MANTQGVYFSDLDLRRFKEAEGKTLVRSVCILWQNNTDPQLPVELIDRLELYFDDGSKLCLSCSEEADGLETTEEDIKELATALKDEFGGKIKLFMINASETEMWKNTIGKKLNAVKVTREEEYYRADSVLLDLGDEKRTVTVHPLDGLIIDHYEEV